MILKQLAKNKYEIEFETEADTERFKDYLFPKKQLKAAEVMEILGISRVTLCHYVKQGKLKVYQAFDGAKYTYDYDSVMKLRK